MITATGKMMGVKTDEFTNKQTGEVRVSRKVGIGMRKERSYEDDLHIFQITLDKDCTPEQIDRLNKLKGKTVSVGAAVSEYEMNGKKGTTFRWNGALSEVTAPSAVAPVAKAG